MLKKVANNFENWVNLMISSNFKYLLGMCPNPLNLYLEPSLSK